ncbi:MAG: NAD-dependent epimerase/dehydratase family protein [Methylobacterium sp.]|nr:NAD-dependent epimerase/dehydratase family protein [Methylobacterium sp.]
MQKETVLVIGACGQLGTELTEALRGIYGENNVVASDVKKSDNIVFQTGPFEVLDILDKPKLLEILEKYKPTQVYHLAALLSATAEKMPEFAWKLNMDGLFHLLDAARDLLRRRPLFADRVRDGRGDLAHLGDGRADPADRVHRVPCRALDRRDLFGDVLGRLRGLGRQRLHLRGNDRVRRRAARRRGGRRRHHDRRLRQARPAHRARDRLRLHRGLRQAAALHARRGRRAAPQRVLRHQVGLR